MGRPRRARRRGEDKPAPEQFRDGWNIRPDLAFPLPKHLKIPAKGTIEYTYVCVSAPFKQDTWVVAGEIRPTDRAYVHHAIAEIRPKGSKWMIQAQLGAEPYARRDQFPRLKPGSQPGYFCAKTDPSSERGFVSPELVRANRTFIERFIRAAAPCRAENEL